MFVSVATSVTLGVLVAVGVAELTDWDPEKVVPMSIKNVTIKPIPMGKMKLSGIVWVRMKGRLGTLLRASGTLRRRGSVTRLCVGAVAMSESVVKPSSDSIARVALCDELRGCASPATNADEMVLVGNSAKAVSIAKLNANPLWYRSTGSFERDLARTSISASGKPLRYVGRDGGDFCAWATIKSGVFPWKGISPQNISYVVIANE